MKNMWLCTSLATIITIFIQLKTVDGLRQAYLQPTYFWPLDYTTWVREVIENKNPSIQGGSSGLGITGKGKGYLKFPLLTSSANLGSYQQKCLTKPQQCDTGLTLGFWVKLSSIKASVYRQEFSFLRTISESIEKAVTLEFVFAVQNDVSAAELSVIVRASNIYKSSIKIGVDKWHHIMITINDRGLKTYLNTQLIPTSKVYNREYKAYDSVTFQLGQYPKLPPSVQSFERATTSVDNLVIWDRVLTNQEIEKIYFVEFGTIKPSCIANSNSHEIFWNKLNDIYNHVTGYSVAWWENGKPHSTMTIPYTMGQKDKNLKAIIEAFQSKRNYNYQISAETLGKKMIKQDVKCSKIAENKKFRLFSDTPSTIFIEWISPKGKYLYEIFLAKTRVGQLNKNPLKYQLTDLKINRAYDVTVRRVNLESGQITSYRENVTTLTIAETMSTSVKSAQIKRNTWNETEIGVILHPELQGKNMTYILINREPSKSESTGKKIPWDNSKNTWLDFTVRNLKPNTEYIFDVVLRDRDSDKLGPRMLKPLMWKTKVKFPTSITVNVLSVESKSVTLSMVTPKDIQVVSASTHIKIIVKSASKTHIRIIPISKAKNFTIGGLEHYTEYEITTALGDGVDFGNETKPIAFKTKVNFSAPKSIKILSITTLNAVFEIISPRQLVDGNHVTRILFQVMTDSSYYGIMMKYNKTNIYELKKLSPLTKYTVRTILGSDKTIGKEASDSITFTTKPNIGTPDIQLLAVGPTHVSVNIARPQGRNSRKLVSSKVITKVVIRIKSNEGKEWRSDTVTLDQIGYYTIKNLSMASVYRVSAAYANESVVYAFGNEVKCTTSVRYDPPTAIHIVEATSRTIRLQVKLSSQQQDLVNKNSLTHIKISLKSPRHSLEVIRVIETSDNVLINNLTYYTAYDVRAACGDGSVFGNFGKAVMLKTKNIDECQNVSNACGLNSKCTNTLGSFICQCLPGYQPNEGNVKGCKDINECVTKRNLCKKNERCQNTPGSFQCQCKNGFKRINGICLSEEEENQMCKFEIYNNITWMTAQAGQMVNQSCPKDYEGFIYRACAMKNKMAKWRKPDSGQCVNKALSALVLNKGSQQVDVIAKSLNTFVKRQDNKMTTGDVSVIVDMMSDLVKDDRNEGSTQETFAENIINVASELLQPKSRNAWTEFPKEKRTVKAAGLLNTADKIIEVSASALKKDSTKKKVIKTENIVMEIQRVKPPTDNDKSVKFNNNLELPPDAININSTLVFVKYNGIEEILGVPRNTTLRKNTNITESYLNSQVTSITVFPTMKKTFEKPVVFSLQHGGLRNNTIPNCVYWHEVHSGGHWSDKGCFVDKYNESHVTCHCYHLTNFAILMSVTDTGKDISDTDELALSLITIIGLTISLGALAIAFISFIFIKTIRSLRNTVHKHLCVALFIAEAIFLFGIDKTANKIGCQVIAASLHYFFLVAFFIMGLEGIVLYLMLVRVYRSMGTSGYGSPKFIALCWVLPIVIITVNLFIDQNAYGNIHGACWLSITNGFIWSFVGPVLIVILMNFVFLALTIKVMSDKAKRRSSTVDEIWFWTKGVCLLLSILGVTWVVGVLYVSSDTVFFAYLFSVVNSLQGLSIFVFHCACDPRVRKAYRDFFFCVSVRQKHELIRSMSRTRSTSGSKSSLKKSPHSTQAARYISKNKETVPMYSNGSTSTPENSFGLLVGTNKF